MSGSEVGQAQEGAASGGQPEWEGVAGEGAVERGPEGDRHVSFPSLFEEFERRVVRSLVSEHSSFVSIWVPVEHRERFIEQVRSQGYYCSDLYGTGELVCTLGGAGSCCFAPNGRCERCEIWIPWQIGTWLEDKIRAELVGMRGYKTWHQQYGRRSAPTTLLHISWENRSAPGPLSHPVSSTAQASSGSCLLDAPGHLPPSSIGAKAPLPHASSIIPAKRASASAQAHQDGGSSEACSSAAGGDTSALGSMATDPSK